MNLLLKLGTRIVVIALLSYSIAIITEQRKKITNTVVLVFLTLGIVFDIIATAFMVIGSPNSPFTLHGFIGYSALLAMLIDAFLIWKFRLQNGLQPVSKGIHLYSLLAYLWWVIAFITGGLLVALK